MVERGFITVQVEESRKKELRDALKEIVHDPDSKAGNLVDVYAVPRGGEIPSETWVEYAGSTEYSYVSLEKELEKRGFEKPVLTMNQLILLTE